MAAKEVQSAIDAKELSDGLKFLKGMPILIEISTVTDLNGCHGMGSERPFPAIETRYYLGKARPFLDSEDGEVGFFNSDSIAIYSGSGKDLFYAHSESSHAPVLDFIHGSVFYDVQSHYFKKGEMREKIKIHYKKLSDEELIRTERKGFSSLSGSEFSYESNGSLKTDAESINIYAHMDNIVQKMTMCNSISTLKIVEVFDKLEIPLTARLIESVGRDMKERVGTLFIETVKLGQFIDHISNYPSDALAERTLSEKVQKVEQMLEEVKPHILRFVNKIQIIKGVDIPAKQFIESAEKLVKEHKESPIKQKGR